MDKAVLKETYESMLVGIFILRERRWGGMSDGYRPTPSSNRHNLCRRIVQRQLPTDDDPSAVHRSSALNFGLSGITAATAVSDLPSCEQARSIELEAGRSAASGHDVA